MEISAIKQNLSILTLLNIYGLNPDKNHRLHCPFHPDKTPSLQVYMKTNTWTCFSSNCNAGSGDQVDFITYMEKCTKHEAILKAQSFIGLITEPKPQPKPIPISNNPEPTTEQRTAILTESFKHFSRSLVAKHGKAIKYLETRNLNYKQLAIGYDAGTLHKIKETNEEQKQHYLQTGLIKPDKFGRENSYYTRFNGCIVFPLLDKTGDIASLYGRHTDKHEHHYLEGDHKGLYPCYPKPGTRKLILTEAIIDAATLLQNQEPRARNQDLLI